MSKNSPLDFSNPAALTKITLPLQRAQSFGGQSGWAYLRPLIGHRAHPLTNAHAHACVLHELENVSLGHCTGPCILELPVPHSRTSRMALDQNASPISAVTPRENSPSGCPLAPLPTCRVVTRRELTFSRRLFAGERGGVQGHVLPDLLLGLSLHHVNGRGHRDAQHLLQRPLLLGRRLLYHR